MKANLKVACTFFGLAVALVALRAVLVAHVMAGASSHGGLGEVDNDFVTSGLFPELRLLAALFSVAGVAAFCCQFAMLERRWAKEWLYFIVFGVFGLVALIALLALVGPGQRMFGKGEEFIGTLFLFTPYLLFQLVRAVMGAFKTVRSPLPPRIQAASASGPEAPAALPPPRDQRRAS